MQNELATLSVYLCHALRLWFAVGLVFVLPLTPRIDRTNNPALPFSSALLCSTYSTTQ